MTNTTVSKIKTLSVWGLITGLSVGVIFVRHDATAAQAPVSLGAAAKFAVRGCDHDLAPLTTFIATITIGAKDLAGNPLINNFDQPQKRKKTSC